MRKIGLFNIGKLGLVKSAGKAKTDISKVIEKWVKEHMVFWYDMSKPVDTYSQNFNDWRSHPSVNADIIITSTSFVITRFATLNDTVKCYVPGQTKNFPGMKVEVKGIVDGQELYWGYNANVKLVNITQDGTYDIPPLETVNGNLSFRNGNIVGACNITITQLPSGQSVPTNEILKTNPYLQDHSGNNRPLKLNNFLFAAMSGVGGYSYFSESIIKTSSNWYEVLYRGSNNGSPISFNIVGITELNSKNPQRGKIEILDTDASKVIQTITSDGEYNIIIPNSTVNFSIIFGGGTQGEVIPCNVVISPIPLYPNALVTDGVDDYGQVQNLQQGVKMLFMTANPLRLYNTWYVQDSFSIYGQPGITAYNFRNTGGVTYLDGILNEAEIPNNLLNKKQTVTIVNPTDGGNNSIIFFNSYGSSYMNMAFYGSIGFDSVPTKQNDGFTEQDLIDYYIPKAIVTITVVDVSGSPIQDATVTVEGVQYKTLSDGTVKVRGMANGTMSLSVKKDGYMPFSDNSWKLADSRITLEVLRNTVITENGYSILLENDGLILTE